MSWPTDLKFFDRSEFDGPDEMDEGFLRTLDLARHYAGIPFIITSDFRTAVHNADIGGAKDSPHLYGKAVDIRVHNSRERFMIVHALLRAGFRRIGVYDHHVHCDTVSDDTHPETAMWVGTSK